VAILRVEPSAIDRHLTKLRVRMLTPESPEILTGDVEGLDGFIDTFDVSSEYEAEAGSTVAATGIDQPEYVTSDADVSDAVEPKPIEIGELEDTGSADFQSSGTDKSTIQYGGVFRRRWAENRVCYLSQQRPGSRRSSHLDSRNASKI
jgi:hypothetical protein